MKKIWICSILAVLLLTGCQNQIKEGTKQLEEQKYEEAVNSFEKALEKNKDKAEAYRGLGMAYYEQQDYQSARDAFQQVLDNHGEATPVLYNLLGVSTMHLADYEGALNAFTEGLKLAEDDEKSDYADVVQEMRFNQIVCYEKVLDWNNAKEKVASYVRDYPDDKKAQKEAEFLSTR
jgi:tetratricopeptide (TPR) repeat protein